jgi:hypothetical protein
MILGVVLAAFAATRGGYVSATLMLAPKSLLKDLMPQRSQRRHEV